MMWHFPQGGGRVYGHGCTERNCFSRSLIAGWVSGSPFAVAGAAADAPPGAGVPGRLSLALSHGQEIAATMAVPADARVSRRLAGADPA